MTGSLDLLRDKIVIEMSKGLLNCPISNMIAGKWPEPLETQFKLFEILAADKDLEA